MEFLPYTMTQSLAARQEGAIFVWGFWSVIPFLLSWYDHAVADLIQAWGDFDMGMVNTLSFDYRYGIIAGSLGYDGALPDDQERAEAFRAQLTAKPRFVITLFDNSHIRVGQGCYNSTERCAHYYRVVLDLVAANPDWGCLIKSKNADLRDFVEYPELQKMLDGLQQQGRAYVLPKTVKPSLALLAGDAAACFPVNSAGFLAALATGRPVVHFDLTRMTMHPIICEGGEGKIVFFDAEALSKALVSISRGEGIYGDTSPWQHLLDPFRDGMGRRRSGKVMGDYVAARDRGLPADDALREAVQTHADTYGDAFVSTRCAPHDGPGDRLWRKVEEIHYPGRTGMLPYSATTTRSKPVHSAMQPNEGARQP
jgi:hypothetical protein